VWVIPVAVQSLNQLDLVPVVPVIPSELQESQRWIGGVITLRAGWLD
jgi:hypothetical protein